MMVIAAFIPALTIDSFSGKNEGRALCPPFAEKGDYQQYGPPPLRALPESFSWLNPLKCFSCLETTAQI
jgi:hypothetical protein